MNWINVIAQPIRSYSPVLLAALVAIAAGCATPNESPSGSPAAPETSAVQGAPIAAALADGAAASAAAERTRRPAGASAGAPADDADRRSATGESGAAQPRLFRGNDQVIAPAAPARADRSLAGKETSFRFEQAPVREVVHAVLGELLGLTYVLHQPVGGTVTVSTAAPIPVDQALSLLEAVLQGNGILMAQDASGVFHVGPPEALRSIVPVPKRVDRAPLPPGFGSAIVPLKYIGAAEMAEILRPIAQPAAFLRVDTLRNLLILAGSRNQIEGWLEIVRTFDVDLLKGMSVGVFPLQYASVRDVEAALRISIPSLSSTPTAQPATPTAPPGSAAAAAAAAQPALPSHPLLGALRVIPLERLNSLLVVTPRAAYLDEVKVWIERLDRPTDSDTEPRLFVYAVRNGSAQHLANVLNGIFGTATGAAGQVDSGVAPGLRPTTGTTTTTQRSALGTGGAATGRGGLALSGMSTQQSAARPAGIVAATLTTNVRIVGDDLNNSVVVYGPASEFRKIEAALKRLDSPATQVLIEATIVEVTLTDELRYGLQWFFTDSARGGLRGSGGLNLNQEGGIGPQQPGFFYSLTNTMGQVRAVLNALADRSLIRVISSPSLMVLDNHSAAISVGDQQPVRSSVTVSDGGNITTSIEYKDTGVLLTVTPSVNSGDVVSMSINQAVTDVGSIDSATGQRAFLQRQIGSRVAVKSGEALVLGGLIRDNTTGGDTGVPFLSRIPVLGALFGTKTQSTVRTELLVVITPRVIRSEQDAQEVGREMRERMRGFRALADDQRSLLPPGFAVPAEKPGSAVTPER